MAKPFYRRTEAELATGAANLIAIVTPALAEYGLTSDALASYGALSASYGAALATATTPATRTSIAVSAKNDAKRALMSATVDVARTIAAVSTVSNPQLLSLELNERAAPAPRAVPEAPPVIDVVSVFGRRATVRVRAGGSAGSRARAFGAIGANVYSFVGPASPADPRAFHYEGFATRATMEILFPSSVASGATVWLSATWMNARGQTGAGSVPISFTLQGGALAAAA